MESVALLAPVVNYLIKPVVRQVGYLIHYKSNVENLDAQTKDLVRAKERLQHDVDEELRKVGQETEADVKDWLTKTDEIIAEARQFLEDERQAKKCLYGFCRYRPSRKATKVSQKIDVELPKRREFQRLTYSTPLQNIWPKVGHVAFESRTSTVNQILEKLKKDNIYMIGIYGMGGVGKTTLVKQVASKAEEEKLFDNVVIIEVKQNTDVERIQKEIFEKLSLKYGNLTGSERIVRQTEGSDEMPTVAGRAHILSNYIKNKKILIIFDDVWEELDLEKVGVPVGMCKILLTSRTREVLSSKMGIVTNIQLDLLNNEDTWCLFQTIVGDAVKDPDIGEVAIEVANECKGLPILVVTVAKALKGKQLHSWNDVLGRLKGKEMLETAYTGIEWSYNQLEGEELKSLFLFFGMHGGRNYYLRDVLKYTLGYGLSLFKGTNTLEEANSRLHSLVDKLKDCCLLFDTNTNEIVTMHDLTLDVARKIAYTDHNFLSKQYGHELKEWPTKEVLEKCTMISLNKIDIPNLPEELGCPRLQMLLLYSTDETPKIPHNFFKETKELKVLDLTNFCIPSLPPSVQFLTNLQTLCLDQCELSDISIVGKLGSLEILSLLRSKFKHLPKEIGNLTRLRLLDLSNCPELEVIYPDVIKSLTRLEELNMNNSFNKWETEEASNNMSGRSNASLSELKHLPNLTTLGINFKDANQLPSNFFSHEKLKHFNILIGDVWDWDAEYSTSNTLKLKLSQRNQWDQSLETILKRCEDLSLDVFEGVNNIVHDQLVMDGFQRLKKLHVQNNREISHIVNSSIHSHVAFPILEELSLHNLASLESVCSGQLTVDSFKKLKIIKVTNCPKLEHLFSISMLVHEFLELEEIEVEDCKNMKEIVEGKEEQIIRFHGLRSLMLQSLPELISFSSNHSPLVASTSRNPIQLFNDKVVFPKLEALELSSIPLNKFWDDQLSSRLSWIQNLTSLIVEGCDALTFLCSSSMSINTFVQLKTLKIRSCQNMVEIISTEEYGDQVKNMDNMFPKLEILELEALGNLEKFCTSASYIEFPCLQRLNINDCTKLGSFIVDPTTRKNVIGTAEHHLFDDKVSFPRLELLDIEGLHKLTTIWHTQLAPHSFCKLTEINVLSCSSLIHILVPSILIKSLHSLKKLFVRNCESVEAVFEVEGTSGVDQDQSEKFIFGNLIKVEIWNCKSLKNVFPAPVAKLLEKLEFLMIIDCEIMEQIIAEEEVGLQTTITPKFMFPRVTLLILFNLPQLRSFYPGKHISMWPSLKKLSMLGCDKIEILTDEYSSFQQQQHQHETKPLFFLSRKNQVRNENFHLADPVFSNLKLLRVEECGRLKNIVSSAISFRNLVDLTVIGCHGLRHLFTCSVAKSSVQLQSITVESCQRIVEIMASNDDNENIDDADANEITFSRLKDLSLSDLPNLKGFCSRNYNVKFPLLTNLSVTNCLETKISVVDGALQNDSKYKGVLQITEEEEQEEEEDDNDDVDVDDFEKWW